MSEFKINNIIIPEELPVIALKNTVLFPKIVIPIIINGSVYGVFDLDCPVVQGFGDDDAEGLGAIVQLLVNSSDFKCRSECVTVVKGLFASISQ